MPLHEIVLTRDDANSDSVLLVEWLVAGQAVVEKGQAVCLVETSKASIEIEAPATGTLVQLAAAGAEVALGTCIALVAETAEDLAEAEQRRSAGAVAVAAAKPQPGSRTVTRRAAELAAQHGIDLDRIDKAGFISVEDVEALIAGGGAGAGEVDDVLFAGLSTENVTLPAILNVAEGDGLLESGFYDSLVDDPASFAALSSDEKCDAYRRHGARIGENVTFGAGAIVVAPRIVLEDGVLIGAGSSIRCHDVFAAGELTLLGSSFQLSCRRAFIGAGTWTGDRVVVGGGGGRDPWATFVLGELGFLGDEAFINVCRPVVIGREAFVTMRSALLTHNIGHSLLEGFENRFAGIVLEDRAQIGVGAVVYAGCRVGRETIVASNSYVVSDLPAGSLAIGVPARVSGSAKRLPSRTQQAALARMMLLELQQLLGLCGIETAALEGRLEGFELTGSEGPARVVFAERLAVDVELAGEGETVVLALALAGAPPEGCAVLDLLERRVHGTGGVVLESVREFCRKRGIRFEPGPWRYQGGLI